ncbi:MAG: putative porin [Phenylobacterium sp.]|jgi:predicted porin
MNCFKTTLATALALVFAAPTFASEVQVYGKANVSFQSVDEGAGDFTELKSNASRFGLKGDLKLDGDLTAVYKYEVQIDLADEAGEKNLKARNQYVGLKGNFGEILLGRNDTVTKQAQGKVDLFSDYEADLKRQWKGENRMGDSVTYKSPKMNGFQLGVSYIAEDDVAGEDGLSVALTYGDKAYKKSKFYAAIAIDSEVKGYDVVRLIGGVKAGGFKLGFGWQTQEAVGSSTDEDGFLFSAAYPMDKVTFKAQYQTMEDDDTFTIGADYKLGKKTKLFAWYTDLNYDGGTDSEYLAVGIEHKF